jgi:hypothetical protein
MVCFSGVTSESISSLRKYSHVYLEHLESFNDDHNHYLLLALWSCWYYRRKDTELGEQYYKVAISS